MHCLQRTVIWGGDFSLEDYGFYGEGIIHQCHCTNCGAEIIYIIREEEENGESDETQTDKD